MWHGWERYMQSFTDHKEDLGMDRKIILKLILKKYDGTI
jgi:hypothetical protein